MLKVIDKILFYFKVIVHVAVFVLVLYIMLMMNDYYGNSFSNIVSLFIPMLLVLVGFVVSFFFNKGNKNIFFNIANTIALLSIMVICLRTLFDKNMVMGIKDNINYYYFQNQIIQIKILGYMIFMGNVLLIYKDKK